MESNNKNHWETVYETKNPDEVSWTQEIPKTALDYIHSFHLPKNSKIIDIGGGDSNLVDYLIKEGYENITVLDISANAIEKALTGYLVIGTFSENGPKKCSGLEIKQYNEETLTTKMGNSFEKLKCIYENHTTPFDTQQHFVFCSFKRKLN